MVWKYGIHPLNVYSTNRFESSQSLSNILHPLIFMLGLPMTCILVNQTPNIVCVASTT